MERPWSTLPRNIPVLVGLAPARPSAANLWLATPTSLPPQTPPPTPSWTRCPSPQSTSMAGTTTATAAAAAVVVVVVVEPASCPLSCLRIGREARRAGVTRGGVRGCAPARGGRGGGEGERGCVRRACSSLPRCSSACWPQCRWVCVASARCRWSARASRGSHRPRGPPGLSRGRQPGHRGQVSGVPYFPLFIEAIYSAGIVSRGRRPGRPGQVSGVLSSIQRMRLTTQWRAAFKVKSFKAAVISTGIISLRLL